MKELRCDECNGQFLDDSGIMMLLKEVIAMSVEIENAVIEKLRSLTPEQQREVLDFVENLAKQTSTGQMAIWDEIDEIVKQAPPGTWDDVPTDGSINVDHYLYGAPKK
jgi:hypothetical protein